MLQFLTGFWCGCIAATLVLCLTYSNKLRQMKERLEKVESAGGTTESKESKKLPADVPRVLLVDDSRLSRTLMRGMLEKKDLEIIEAANGAECLKMAQKYSVDLIFLDQNMPGADGDEILQLLWDKCGVKHEVPVVAVGSTIRKANEKEFRQKGYVACLGKPIQENRMDEILEQVLTGREEEQKPEGFSYRNGLANFDGNEEVYRETLVLFAELWAERKEQLRQFLEEENMPEYAILIHAIKGDARTLGADVLGGIAYEQELKAKAGNYEAVKADFERVILTGDKTAEYFKRMFS